jgi:uncharacterized protein DUF3866
VIRIRRGIVLETLRRRHGLTECLVEIEGEKSRALSYDSLVGALSAGDRVILNTTAVSLGLGTGGVHFVIAVEGGSDLDPSTAGHAVKLRYTPLQAVVHAVEDEHRERIDAFGGLAGAPVVAAGLHSALAAAAIGARAAVPGARIAYVMTEGGALPAAFSHAVSGLREAGLLDATITCGQAFGGDYEAVNLFGALAAASTVVEADVILVAMGPGNLGTGSRWGFALMEVAGIVNAVGALDGRPIVVPRLSFSDERPRHRGVSHHTLTALSVAALAPADIALPSLSEDRALLVRRQLEESGALRLHRIVEVDLGAAEEALSRSPVPLESMGRSYSDDPDPFRAAAAAGVLAARESAKRR